MHELKLSPDNHGIMMVYCAILLEVSFNSS